MNNYYVPFSNFILRTPTLPLTDLKVLENTVYQSMNSRKETAIQEAIFIASPTLYRQLFDPKERKKDKNLDKAIESYLKYLIRMSTRATPFGLFSSCSVGKIDIQTELYIGSSLIRKTRLDSKIVFAIFERLNSTPNVRKVLKFFPNNTLYSTGKYYRYVDQLVKDDINLFSIASVKSSQALKKVLKAAQNGSLISQLVNELYLIGIDDENATSYIEELIKSNILLSELNTPLAPTEVHFLKNKMKQISTLLGFEKAFFSNIQNQIQKLDQNQINSFDTYENIRKKLLLVNHLNSNDLLFQVDQYKEGANLSLGVDIIHELQSVVNFFVKNTSLKINPDIKEFQEAFYNRYEDQEIPLSIALDPDLGLGYPVNYGISDNSGKIIKELQPFLHKARSPVTGDIITRSILVELAKTQTKEPIQINIDREKNQEVQNRHLPDTIYAFFQIFKNDEEGPLLYIKGIGAGGANLFSRFSHLHQDIKFLINEITKKEDELNDNAIIAEIIHLPPNTRVGNILKRGNIRSHEIEYFTASTLERDKKIPVSDILISVKNGSIELRSKKHKKRIVPRLTTAHNFNNRTLPIYRFLCDLQYHNVFSGFAVNLEAVRGNSNYVPRVCLGKSILSLATWIIYDYEFNTLTNPNLYESFIKKWRCDRQIPQRVLLIKGDNELLIDLTFVPCIKILLSELKKRKILEVKEFLFTENDTPIKGENGSFANEIIVPFYKTKK